MNKNIKFVVIFIILIIIMLFIFNYVRSGKLTMGRGLFLITILLVILGMIMYVYKKIH